MDICKISFPKDNLGLKTLLAATFLLFIMFAHAQQRDISGIVIEDESNQPLAGASIRIKGTERGCISDKDGKFLLRGETAGQSVLVLSYVGMKTVELPVSGKFIRIKMQPDSHLLDEVRVQVAYGTAQRKSLTGAVSVVDGKMLEMRPLTTATSVLDGATTGVQIMDAVGQPGMEPAVSIRGYSSVNGVNSPLYVVDGMPYTGGISDINPADVESITVLKDAASCALYGSRASNGVILIITRQGKTGKLSMQLDIRQGTYNRGQGDYERMNARQFMETMWKGYRNQLVSQGKTPQEAAAEAGNSLVDGFLLTNIYDKANDALFDSEGNLVSGARILDSYAEDLDWYNPMVRNGYRQEYNISGEKATDKSRLYFSLGYLDEDGYLVGSSFDRISGRLNADIHPVKWLKSGLNIGATHQNQDLAAGAQSSTVNTYANTFQIARLMAPIYPVHLHYAENVLGEDGSLLHSKGDYVLAEGKRQYDRGTGTRNQYAGRHLIWENEKDGNRSFYNSMQGNAYADLLFMNDFTFTLKGNLSTRNSESRRYYNSEIGDGESVGGRTRHTIFRIKEYSFQEILRWAHTYNKHSLEWMGGHENYYFKRNYTLAEKSGEKFTGSDDLTNFTNISLLSGYEDNYRTEGYFTQLRYRYNDTYFADASFRRDGSSMFFKDTRWGNFWSVGAAWMLSNEAFLKDVSWLDMLKLRASYGEVGNDNANLATSALYQWMALYASTQNGGEAAYYKLQNESKDLKWESNTSLSLAMEARLFDRLNVSIEYFDKRSRDLLFDVSLPLSAGGTDDTTGLSSITRNIGTVSNRGWEFSVDADIFRTKDWTWNAGLRLSTLKNKIVKLPLENRENGILDDVNYKKYMEGHSCYDFWLYQFAGVDQMTGQSLYQPDFEAYYVAGEDGKTPVHGNADGKPLPATNLIEVGGKYYTDNVTYARKDWSGSSIPKAYGSFSTSLRWKDLTLSALFNFGLGAKVLDLPYMDLMSQGGSPHALSTDLLEAWNGVPEGMTETSPNRIDPAGIPQVNFETNGFSNALSSRFLTSGDYLHIKNITLAYRLPQMWTTWLGLQDIRLNASVENAALFTKRKGLNPIQNFSGVADHYVGISRVFSFGVSVKL